MSLLQTLKAKAERLQEENADLLPVGYANRTIHWIINVDEQSKEDAVIKQRRLRIPAPIPPTDRTNSISPNMLVDKLSYALAVPQSDESSKEHETFLRLLENVSKTTRDAQIASILKFLKDPSRLSKIQNEIVNQSSDKHPNANHIVAFQVGGNPWPMESKSVQDFWSTYMENRFGGDLNQCVVCGRPKKEMRILPFKATVSASIQLSSFNERAFCSGGHNDKSSGNASICYSCAGSIGQSLEYLTRQDKNEEGKLIGSGRHMVTVESDPKRKSDSLRNHVAVFWTKQPAILETATSEHRLDEIPLLTLGEVPDQSANEPPAHATQMRAILEANWKGGITSTSVAKNRFYLAVLSPNKSRLVVRQWLDTDVAQTRDNVKAYVNGLQITHPDGRGIWFPPLPAILNALQSPVSSNKKSDEKARLPQVEPELMAKMIKCMFTGTPPPVSLLARAVRCFRVPEPATDKFGQRERQMLRRMALASAMKLILTHNNSEEQKAMEQLKTNHDNKSDYKTQSPYCCGRLLAVLEAIQRRAQGKVGATLVDRFYGSAATAPASIFANLLGTTTKAHLPKLRRENKEMFRTQSSGEKSVNINDIMSEVCNAVNDADGFLETQTTEQQSQFALGFYHQRAEMTLPRNTKSGS